MPKSKREKIKSYRRKLRRLEEEEKHHKKRRRIVYSSSDETSDNEPHGQSEIEGEPDRTSHDEAGALGETPSNYAPVSDCGTEPTAPEVAINGNTDPIQSMIPELDPDILSALGETTEETPKFGEKIHDKLAQLWQPILRKGLTKEVKEKLIKQFAVPENCPLLQAPKLNPELLAAVSEPTRFKDKRVEQVQQQLGLGLTALNKGLSLLLEPDGERVLAIKHLSDSCRILCDLHFLETEARKRFITPGLEKTFLSIIKDVERDDTLFGNGLSNKIKASKAIEKQGFQIKKAVPTTKAVTASPTPASNNRPRFQGNWMGPPRYSSNRGGRGGQRKPAQAPRRTTHAAQSKAPPSSRQHAPSHHP
ncbi:uncharacterized protein LOC126370261 [Pectinophora gossypiella]|uniref:uncharacterized protein LOC126369342 n=1 Tax=Pectinophora gossypiella TaxID=13191 RepID=UPI00214F5277|nr:uncharacterized protein LOC126369342 [Pectinophora gossypiella]XP_049871040.1 uncharacterized protein LOC126370261 [Pectinophora gossypiella]XP_049871041.1 uncharacterized protein LOC126370261 [Pectinophora gossypiella]